MQLQCNCEPSSRLLKFLGWKTDTNALMDSCPPWNRTVDTLSEPTSDFDAAQFCAKYAELPLPPQKRPRLFYGIMFGYEFDMLEVALHEAYPVVDKFILTESTVTHALIDKPLQFDDILSDERFHPFLDKIANFTFNPSSAKKYRSGWDVERRQRKIAIHGAMTEGIRDGDIFIANMDLDEVFSRNLLLRLKFCKYSHMDSDDGGSFEFDQVHFRYHLQCLQDAIVSTHQKVVFYWSEKAWPTLDLYKQRGKRTIQKIDVGNLEMELRARDGLLVWHLSTFGNLREIVRKLDNSPHRHLGEFEPEDVAREANECYFSGSTRFRVDLPIDLFPLFVQRNACRFQNKGWFRRFSRS